MNIDIHEYKRKLRNALFFQLQQLDIFNQPLDWMWVYYALRSDSFSNSIVDTENISQIVSWINNPTAAQPKNLGALGLACYLLLQLKTKDVDSVLTKLVGTTNELLEKPIAKFSALNDPIIFYGITKAGKESFTNQRISDLETYCKAQCATDNIRRSVIFSASLCELGSHPSQLSIRSNDISPNEMPVLLWFADKYPNILDIPKSELWDLFFDNKEQVIFESAELLADGNFFTLNAVDLSMLFIAVSNYAGNIDPNTLYKLLLLHPIIRSSSENLFMKGEYVSAVFEAAKTFIDEIKQKAGHPIGSNNKPLDGRQLIQTTFSSQSPILKFNNLVSQSDKDEHDGLKLIAEGVVAAIRNPKGHEQKDNIYLPPDEAIDQLVVMSYLLKRLDRI